MNLRKAALLSLLACCAVPPAATNRTTAMARHDLIAVGIRDAVVNGDLRAARDYAELLGRVVLESGESAKRRAEMYAATETIANASDLPTAAHGTGDLIATCAGCHEERGRPVVTTSLERRPMPPFGMQRHAWAMNELWDGAIGGAEERWQAGAETLATPTNAAPPTTAEAKMEALGRRARAAHDVAIRAAIYGELLATCATCHSRRR